MKIITTILTITLLSFSLFADNTKSIILTNDWDYSNVINVNVHSSTITSIVLNNINAKNVSNILSAQQSGDNIIQYYVTKQREINEKSTIIHISVSNIESLPKGNLTVSFIDLDGLTKLLIFKLIPSNDNDVTYYISLNRINKNSKPPANNNYNEKELLKKFLLSKMFIIKSSINTDEFDMKINFIMFSGKYAYVNIMVTPHKKINLYKNFIKELKSQDITQKITLDTFYCENSVPNYNVSEPAYCIIKIKHKTYLNNIKQIRPLSFLFHNGESLTY